MTPVHPGRILRREPAAREMSANRLALALHLPSGRITDILNGKRAISPDTALRLGRYFGNSPRFWLNLQTANALAVAERDIGKQVAAEVKPNAASPERRCSAASARVASRLVLRGGEALVRTWPVSG